MPVMVLGWDPPAPLASRLHGKARDLKGLWYFSASGALCSLDSPFEFELTKMVPIRYGNELIWLTVE